MRSIYMVSHEGGQLQRIGYRPQRLIFNSWKRSENERMMLEKSYPWLLHPVEPSNCRESLAYGPARENHWVAGQFMRDGWVDG